MHMAEFFTTETQKFAYKKEKGKEVTRGFGGSIMGGPSHNFHCAGLKVSEVGGITWSHVCRVTC